MPTNDVRVLQSVLVLGRVEDASKNGALFLEQLRRDDGRLRVYIITWEMCLLATSRLIARVLFTLYCV